jgi:hypothetical protein
MSIFVAFKALEFKNHQQKSTFFRKKTFFLLEKATKEAYNLGKET